jgi:hypothetical protein
MWLRKRFLHFWRITRLGWFVIYEVGWVFLYLNIDFMIEKFGTPSQKSYWEHLTHPQWGWKIWAIGALVILIFFLIEGSYRSYCEIEEKLGKAEGEMKEAEKRFSEIGGPELFIGYVPDAYRYNPVLIVINHKSCIAYNVVLKIPEDGSKILSKEINILKDDETPVNLPVGPKNMIDSADVVMAHVEGLPVIVTCMDADCRRFTYRFNQPPSASSRLAFTLVDKRCEGRSKQLLPSIAYTQDSDKQST